MELTRTFSAIFHLLVFLFFAGIVFASELLVTLMVIPLLLIFSGFFLNQPQEIAIKREKEKVLLLTGDILTTRIDITIDKGIGIVTLTDKLPGNFQLIEGNNFMVVWKGFKPKKVSMEYKVKVVTSGIYHLNTLFWEARHLLNFKAPIVGKEKNLQLVEVRPKLLAVKKDGNITTTTKIPQPLGSLAKMGIPTLDFKEMRQYAKGDSFKYINWKATARSVSRGGFNPIVNEYEKEGKKMVWIFLDQSNSMQFGLNIKNASEYALESVNGLADYYLRQNCQVSFCTFNGKEIFIYPGEGKKQYHKILKTILQLTTLEQAEEDSTKNKKTSLKQVVIKHKKYLVGSRPLCIIVTRVNSSNTVQMREGIKEVSKYTGLLGHTLAVMIINIGGYDLAAGTLSEEKAAELLQVRDSRLSQKLRKNIMWIDWNPAKINFTKAFLQQVVKR